MCGICGLIKPGGATRHEVQVMMDAIRHRGPDDEGYHLGGMAALGHRRLSIIDLEGGHQPIANEDETLWIVYNGEVYNYRELREGLQDSHHFKTDSDTEVILHLFEESGPACVTQLRGMFAFAIWNDRDQSLFLARDHLGQKPLYYAHSGGRFAFASEIKALLAADPGLRVMNPEALHQYLTLRIIAPPRSMFTGVKKLPPGHTLLFRDGKVLIERYWDLEYEPKHALSEDQLLDALDEQIREAVRYHLVSDVPVGAFLSGGLDSSLVVAIMSELTNQRVKTFTIDVPYQDYSEAPYARMVAERYQTDHYEETITPSLVKVLPELVYHLDEPSDPLSAPMYYISEMARRHVKVVLGGDGGDELFGGYDRYYGNRYADYYARIPAALRSRLIGPVLERMPDGFWYKSLSHKLKWLHQLSFFEQGRRYSQSLSYFYFNQGFRGELYGPRLQESLGGFDPEADIFNPYDGARATQALDRMLYADSMVRLPDHPVMILDRTTMAHGLEARPPFMDHKLAEFAARIPVDFKVRGRNLRYLQTQLARRYLPAELIQRPKQGFSSGLPYMLSDEFRLLFRTFLTGSHLASAGYLRQGPIQSWLEEHLARRVDHGNRLWLLCNAEVWYRMAIDGWSPEEIRGQMTAGPPIAAQKV